MSDYISILLSSFLPIFLTVLFGWIGNRNDRAQRRKMFDDAKQRIELINAYVASQKLVIDDTTELGNLKKIAASELYAIKESLDKKLRSLEKHSEKSESYWRRFFLLYKPRTGLAGFFRAFFFLMLLMSILWSAFWASIYFAPASLQKYNLAISIIVVIIFALPGVLVILLLRWLAIKFDKPANSPEKVESVQ